MEMEGHERARPPLRGNWPIPSTLWVESSLHDISEASNAFMSVLAVVSIWFWTPLLAAPGVDGRAVDDLNVEKVSNALLRAYVAGYKAFYRYSIGWYRATRPQTSLGLEEKGCVQTLLP